MLILLTPKAITHTSWQLLETVDWNLNLLLRYQKWQIIQFLLWLLLRTKPVISCNMSFIISITNVYLPNLLEYFPSTITILFQLLSIYYRDFNLGVINFINFYFITYLFQLIHNSNATKCVFFWENLNNDHIYQQHF